MLRWAEMKMQRYVHHSDQQWRRWVAHFGRPQPIVLSYRKDSLLNIPEIFRAEYVASSSSQVPTRQVSNPMRCRPIGSRYNYEASSLILLNDTEFPNFNIDNLSSCLFVCCANPNSLGNTLSLTASKSSKYASSSTQVVTLRSMSIESSETAGLLTGLSADFRF